MTAFAQTDRQKVILPTFGGHNLSFKLAANFA
jgi:hypothetical protein